MRATGGGRQAGEVERHACFCKGVSVPAARAFASPTRLANSMAERKPVGQAVGLCAPTWWAPNGFAVIPTTAIDPPHRAASPAVPALIGSGSPSMAHFEFAAIASPN